MDTNAILALAAALSIVAGNIRSAMLIAMALMEALTIYGLLIAFMLVSRIG